MELLLSATLFLYATEVLHAIGMLRLRPWLAFTFLPTTTIRPRSSSMQRISSRVSPSGIRTVRLIATLCPQIIIHYVMLFVSLVINKLLTKNIFSHLTLNSWFFRNFEEIIILQHVNQQFMINMVWIVWNTYLDYN